MFGLFTANTTPRAMRREDGVTGVPRTFPPDDHGVPMAFASFGPVGLQMIVDPHLPDSLLSHETIHRMGLGSYLQTMEINHQVNSRYGSGGATRFPLPFMNFGHGNSLTVNDLLVCVLEHDMGHDVLGMSFLSRVHWERHGGYIDVRPL